MTFPHCLFSRLPPTISEHREKDSLRTHGYVQVPGLPIYDILALEKEGELHYLELRHLLYQAFQEQYQDYYR